MKIKENSLYLLYRRSKSKYIKSLYEKGEIYINTIDYIRKCDDNENRSDPDDSIHKRTFLGDTKIRVCDCGLDIDKHGVTFDTKGAVLNFDSSQKGNIYCLSGIYTKHITGNRQNLEFDTRSFGESLILIHNPKEFIKRIIKGLNDAGFENVLYKAVEYYPNNYSGYVGFFKKHEKFSYQNEFRIFVPNKKDKPIKITIGSLKDIAIIKNNRLIKVTYSDKKEQQIKIG